VVPAKRKKRIGIRITAILSSFHPFLGYHQKRIIDPVTLGIGRR
jgi:hypothetical protein